MAQPNGLNPTFEGAVKSRGHRHGGSQTASVICVAATGTTVVDVFGARNGFNGKVLDVYVISAGTTNSFITVIGTDGSMATLQTTGSGLGTYHTTTNLATTVTVANAFIKGGGTLQISSDSAADQAQVYITYKVD